MTATMSATERQFGNPFDIPSPPDMEGWKRLYPAHDVEGPDDRC